MKYISRLSKSLVLITSVSALHGMNDEGYGLAKSYAKEPAEVTPLLLQRQLDDASVGLEDFLRELVPNEGCAQKGDSWLHLFVRAANVPMVQFVCQRGASWTQENADGETPEDILRGLDDSEVKRDLEACMQDPFREMPVAQDEPLTSVVPMSKPAVDRENPSDEQAHSQFSFNGKGKEEEGLILNYEYIQHLVDDQQPEAGFVRALLHYGSTGDNESLDRIMSDMAEHHYNVYELSSLTNGQNVGQWLYQVFVHYALPQKRIAKLLEIVGPYAVEYGEYPYLSLLVLHIVHHKVPETSLAGYKGKTVLKNAVALRTLRKTFHMSENGLLKARCGRILQQFSPDPDDRNILVERARPANNNVHENLYQQKVIDPYLFLRRMVIGGICTVLCYVAWSHYLAEQEADMLPPLPVA